MKEITTVLGDISDESLGFCQCHEHLMIAKGMSYIINSALCIDDIQSSINELLRYRLMGGNSIVDAQPVGCGRMARELCEISRESGVNIISSTGFHKTIFYPQDHWIFTASEQELTGIFVNDIENGMYVDCDTDYPVSKCSSKAGIIKTALDKEGLTPVYKKLFQAAITAAKKTGTPIMAHIEAGANPIDLADFLLGHGLPASKIIFCHLDRAVEDLDIHKQICKEGIYLEYDTIGRYKYHSDQYEINIIKEMILSSYEDNILISLDTTRQRLLSYGGEIGLAFILEKFIPQLKDESFGDEIIKKITIENPAKAISKY